MFEHITRRRAEPKQAKGKPKIQPDPRILLRNVLFIVLLLIVLVVAVRIATYKYNSDYSFTRATGALDESGNEYGQNVPRLRACDRLSGIIISGGNSTVGDDLLRVPSAGMDPGQGTVEMLVYVDGNIKDTSTNHFIFSLYQYGTAVSNGIFLFHSSNGKWEFWTTDEHGFDDSIPVNVTDSLATGWHRFAIRWRFDEDSLWIDGVKVAHNETPRIPQKFYDDAWVGTYDGGQQFMDSTIRDMMISDVWRDDDALAARGGTSALTPDANTVWYNLLVPQVSRLQATIYDDAGVRTTVLGGDITGSESYLVVPSGAMIDGGGHNLKNVSLVVLNASNVIITNLRSDGTVHAYSHVANVFPIINISGVCSNVTVSGVHINNSRIGSPPIYINGIDMDGIHIDSCDIIRPDDTGLMMDGWDCDGLSGAGPSFRNITISNSTANWCGVYNRPSWSWGNWSAGFDLLENSYRETHPINMTNVLVINCSASYNWESGFHVEPCGGDYNCSIVDCTASYNGQRAPMPISGAGYSILSSFNLTGCVADSNFNGFLIHSAYASGNKYIVMTNCSDVNSAHIGTKVSGELYMAWRFTTYDGYTVQWVDMPGRGIYDSGTVVIRDHRSYYAGSGENKYLDVLGAGDDTSADCALMLFNTPRVYVSNYTIVDPKGYDGDVYVKGLIDSSIDLRFKGGDYRRRGGCFKWAISPGGSQPDPFRLYEGNPLCR